MGRVRADDQDYYAADGFSVSGYQEDPPCRLSPELRVYRAQIAVTSPT